MKIEFRSISGELLITVFADTVEYSKEWINQVKLGLFDIPRTVLQRIYSVQGDTWGYSMRAYLSIGGDLCIRSPVTNTVVARIPTQYYSNRWDNPYKVTLKSKITYI
jgi:hypothetical protein